MGRYASWLMEYEREKLGLDPKDESKDEEIYEYLSRGEKSLSQFICNKHLTKRAI